MAQDANSMLLLWTFDPFLFFGRAWHLPKLRCLLTVCLYGFVQNNLLEIGTLAAKTQSTIWANRTKLIRHHHQKTRLSTWFCHEYCCVWRLIFLPIFLLIVIVMNQATKLRFFKKNGISYSKSKAFYPFGQMRQFPCTHETIVLTNTTPLKHQKTSR